MPGTKKLGAWHRILGKTGCQVPVFGALGGMGVFGCIGFTYAEFGVRRLLAVVLMRFGVVTSDP